MVEVILGILLAAFDLLARMAPYLILGIVVAGGLHIVLPVGLVAKYLGSKGLKGVWAAAAIGVPLPLCSCGVVPVAASLRKSGASRSSTVSFLVTTPTSGVDSILATYSLLGGALAAMRVLSSFVIGLVAGTATELTVSRKDEEAASCAADQTDLGDRTNPLTRGLSYAFVELLGGIARPLLIGTLLGGVIAYVLPPGILGQYVGDGVMSYLLLMVVGVPLYVCASGSIPLAAALLVKGISPGAVLVFLITGPATNAATIAVVSGMLGRKTLVIYLIAIGLGALGAGALTDMFFNAYPSFLPQVMEMTAHGAHGLSLFEIVTGALLGGLVMFHVIKNATAKFRGKGEPPEGAYVLRVADMTCQHCARSIKEAVTGMAGVGSVDANPATKLVSFDLKDGADKEALIKAISEAGFHPEPLGKGN